MIFLGRKFKITVIDILKIGWKGEEYIRLDYIRLDLTLGQK